VHFVYVDRRGFEFLARNMIIVF
jgi:hypothetical protein